MLATYFQMVQGKKKEILCCSLANNFTFNIISKPQIIQTKKDKLKLFYQTKKQFAKTVETFVYQNF